MLTTRRSVMAGASLMALGAGPEAVNAWRFEFPSIEEGTLRLAEFRGKVMLVVNTASFCAYTPQFRQLEAMHRDLEAKGLVVIGVPSQDFGQEKGSNADVKAFCELTYGVQFPMAGLSKVRGAEAAPFYKWVREQRRWEPQWNFAKVLIGRDGAIVGTYGSSDPPDRGTVRMALDAALRRPEA